MENTKGKSTDTERKKEMTGTIQDNGGMGGQTASGMGAVGDYGNGSAMRTMQGRSILGMGGMEQSGEDVKAKLEYRAKMKKYREKHDKAVETFKTITGETVETREGAVKALAWIMKNKSYAQAAEAIMAASDFCWACNEEEAEKDVKEEVTTLTGLMR
jgi:hypothetical protein